MQTFFYSAGLSACDCTCRYWTCGKRCLFHLQQMEILKDIMVIPAGSSLCTAQNMPLRSGDLVILFAGDAQQLNALVAIKDIFETFRIILIVGRQQDVGDGKCYLLNPRYITSIEHDVAGLQAVVGKMAGTAANRPAQLRTGPSAGGEGLEVFGNIQTSTTG